MVGGSLRVTGMTWSERSDWRFDDATWSDLHLDSPKVCGSNVETINWYSTVECTGGGGLLLGESIVKPNRRFYQAPSAEVYYTYLFSARNTTEKNTLSSDSKPNVNLRHTNTEIRSWTLLIMGYRIHFKSSCSFFRAKLGRKSNKDYWTGMRRRGRRRRRRRMEGGQNRQRARKKTVGVEVSRQPVGETKIEKNTRTQQKKKTQKMMCNIPPSSPVIAW